MAIPGISVAKSANAKTWARGIVFVDAESVLEAVEAVEDACSGPSLAIFLKSMVSPYFREVVIENFLEQHNGGHNWPPLSDSTVRIRHALGYYNDQEVNIREGELLKFVAETRDYSVTSQGAEMTLPEGISGPLLERKLKTAQQGYTQTSRDMLPGAYTPPRPVIPDLTGNDLVAVLKMLQVYIMNATSARMATIGDMGP